MDRQEQQQQYRDEFLYYRKQGFWTLGKSLTAILAMLVVLYGIGFLATGGDLAIYRFWAPKRAAAEYQVFKNTPAFVQGKIRALAQYKLEYETAEKDNQKMALKQMIVTEAAEVDMNLVAESNPSLAAFVRSLQ